MANTTPWPPVAFDLQNRLLAGGTPAVVDTLVNEESRTPRTAFTDAELDQARQDNGDEPRVERWDLRAQMGWIMRQPVSERIYYLVPEIRNAYLAWPGKSTRVTAPLSNQRPVGGDARVNIASAYTKRKEAGELYSQQELPDTIEQARRVQSRKDGAQDDDNDTCRTCFLNNVRPGLCSRSAEDPTPIDEACTRCSRLGVTCLDLNGRVLVPQPQTIATGHRNNLRFDRCQRCITLGRNCDREHPCKNCSTAVPSSSAGTDCVLPRARIKTNKLIAGSAVGTGDPEYFMALGYGPWGIGVRRPEHRPDLPGPDSGEPFSNRRSVVNNPIREEVVDHLEKNKGAFDWDPLFTDEVRTAALSQTSYTHPEDQVLPKMSSAPPSAQGGVPQFRTNSPPPPRAGSGSDARSDEPESQGQALLQASVAGSVGLSAAPRQQFYDNPHRPPLGDPNLPSDGDLPPAIFRFDDVHGEGFDPVLLLQDDDPMDLDIDTNMNYESTVGPTGQGSYGGGVDYQGALSRRLGDALSVTTRKQAPNTVLTLGQTPGMGAAMGAARIPTSPLPLSGPLFAADADPLPPFGTESWSLDLFPAASFDEVAGSTIPTDSIGMEFPAADPADPVLCDEPVDDNDTPCGRPAVAKCVDRYHPVLNAPVNLCLEHSTIRKELQDEWTLAEKRYMRAYPCSRCLESMVTAGVTPYAQTGTRIFGVTNAAGYSDPVATTLNGRAFGGLQGRTIHTMTGCTCAKKLIQTSQCGAHRASHLEKLKRQARRMYEWRISLSRDEYKTCYLCRDAPGVDHYEFINVEGGNELDYLFYMCMICQGVVTMPDDPNATPENRRAIRDRLRGDIREDFDMPDPVEALAAAPAVPPTGPSTAVTPTKSPAVPLIQLSAAPVLAGA